MACVFQNIDTPISARRVCAFVGGGGGGGKPSPGGGGGGGQFFGRRETPEK
jgi:hypothetical protein